VPVRTSLRRRRALAGAALALVVLGGAVAACSGAPDDNADVDDAPVPRPLTTATSYVSNSLRVNYHTDVIAFMDPLSGSQELEAVEGVVASLPVKSALLITSDRAYDEARCLLAGRTDVMSTLDPSLVPTQFRIDLGGDPASIVAAAKVLKGQRGVLRVVPDPDDPTSSPTTGAASGSGNGQTVGAVPTQCQAEGIRIK
jgi:hypothetical protein